MTIIHEGVAVTSLVLERAVPSATRDGVTLRATVFRTDEPRPVVLVRNPYGETMTRSIPVALFTDAGLAVVVQDCRGTRDSPTVILFPSRMRRTTPSTRSVVAAQSWSIWRRRHVWGVIFRDGSDGRRSAHTGRAAMRSSRS